MNAYQFLKVGLLPGTLGLLFALQSLGLVWLWRRRGSRAALLAISVITATYCAVSMPVIAYGISRAVAGRYMQQADARDLSGVRAIVILDGGTSRTYADGIEFAWPNDLSAVRAIEGIRSFRILRGEPVVVVSGGDYGPAGRTAEGAAIREVLIANGVGPERVVLDTASRNTREHAVHVPRILESMGITRFAVVTSAVHMRRAMRAFTSAGFLPIAAPAPLQPVPDAGWWPTTSGLDQSLEAFYELAGLLLGK